MFKSRKTIFGLLAGFLVVAIVAIIAVVNIGGASAVQAAPAEQAKPTVTVPPAAQAKIDELNQVLGQFKKNFAAKLGVDEAKLDAAFSGAVSDTVDQLVKDGKLSQAQADAIKALSKNGLQGINIPLPQGTIDQLKNAMPFNLDGLKQFEGKVASTLGLSTTELESQIMAGKSLAEIAAAQKVDVNTLKSTIQSDITAQINDAVKNGKLTQAQADEANSHVSALLDKVIDAHFNGKFPFGK